MAQNTHHIVQDRGRVVGCHMGVQRFIDVITPVEVGRFAFTATPQETAYRVCPIVRVLSAVPFFKLDLTIETEDEDGNYAADDEHEIMWTRPREGAGAWGMLSSRPESQLIWPQVLKLMTGTEEYALGWYKHTVDADLPTVDRVLKVSALAYGSPIDGYNIALIGLAVMGYTG